MSVKLKVTLSHLTNHNKPKWPVNQSKPSKLRATLQTRVKRGNLYIVDASRHSCHKGNPVTVYIYHIYSWLSFKSVNAISFYFIMKKKHLKIEGSDRLKAVCMTGWKAHSFSLLSQNLSFSTSPDSSSALLRLMYPPYPAEGIRKIKKGHYVTRK